MNAFTGSVVFPDKTFDHALDMATKLVTDVVAEGQDFIGQPALMVWTLKKDQALFHRIVRGLAIDADQIEYQQSLVRMRNVEPHEYEGALRLVGATYGEMVELVQGFFFMSSVLMATDPAKLAKAPVGKFPRGHDVQIGVMILGFTFDGRRNMGQVEIRRRRNKSLYVGDVGVAYTSDLVGLSEDGPEDLGRCFYEGFADKGREMQKLWQEQEAKKQAAHQRRRHSASNSGPNGRNSEDKSASNSGSNGRNSEDKNVSHRGPGHKP